MAYAGQNQHIMHSRVQLLTMKGMSGVLRDHQPPGQHDMTFKLKLLLYLVLAAGS